MNYYIHSAALASRQQIYFVRLVLIFKQVSMTVGHRLQSCPRREDILKTECAASRTAEAAAEVAAFRRQHVTRNASYDSYLDDNDAYILLSWCFCIYCIKYVFVLPPWYQISIRAKI